MSIRALARETGVHEATLRKRGVTVDLLAAPHAHLAIRAQQEGHPGDLADLVPLLGDIKPTSYLLTIDGRHYVMDDLERCLTFIDLHPPASSHLSPVGKWALST